MSRIHACVTVGIVFFWDRRVWNWLRASTGIFPFNDSRAGIFGPAII